MPIFRAFCGDVMYIARLDRSPDGDGMYGWGAGTRRCACPRAHRPPSRSSVFITIATEAPLRIGVKRLCVRLLRAAAQTGPWRTRSAPGYGLSPLTGLFF